MLEYHLRELPHVALGIRGVLGAVEIQIEPVGEFNLKAQPYRVLALLLGYVDDKPRTQIVQYIQRSLSGQHDEQLVAPNK